MSNGYIAIPKTMRKFSEEKFGISHQRIAIIISWVFASILLLFLAGRSGMAGKVIFIGLLLSMWAFYVALLRNSEILDRTVLTYKYFIRKMNGQAAILKYTAPVSFLQQIVPIVGLHKNGLIEFVEKRYGLLLRIDPKRVSDDELDGHISKVKDIVDSLHGDMVMKTFVVSRSSMVKPLEKNLIDSINTGDKTQQQKEHLYSLYHEVHENTTPVIEWQFFIFLGLGQHLSIEDAEIARQAHLPGFEDRLYRAGMHAIPVTNELDLAVCFRQCFTQEAV